MEWKSFNGKPELQVMRTDAFGLPLNEQTHARVTLIKDAEDANYLNSKWRTGNRKWK